MILRRSGEYRISAASDRRVLFISAASALCVFFFAGRVLVSRSPMPWLHSPHTKVSLLKKLKGPNSFATCQRTFLSGQVHIHVPRPYLEATRRVPSGLNANEFHQ